MMVNAVEPMCPRDATSKRCIRQVDWWTASLILTGNHCDGHCNADGSQLLLGWEPPPMYSRGPMLCHDQRKMQQLNYIEIVVMASSSLGYRRVWLAVNLMRRRATHGWLQNGSQLADSPSELRKTCLIRFLDVMRGTRMAAPRRLLPVM